MTQWRWLPFADLSRTDLYAVFTLRQEVFVVEQRCAYSDIDGRDPEAMHLLGVRDGQLAAYLRAFLPDAQGVATIGRVVVAVSERGNGTGRELMEVGGHRIWEAFGPHPIRVSAQRRLHRFYEELGYEVTGAGYDEDGIPHLPMQHPGPARG